MLFWKKKKQEHRQNVINGEENNISSLINYLPDGLLVFDAGSKLILINAQAEKIFEAKANETLGKSILELSRFKNFKPLVSLLGGGIKETLKKDIQLKENLILEVNTAQIQNTAARNSVVVVLHDVTREKLVEKMKSEFVTVAAHQLRTPTSAIKWSLGMLLDGDLGALSKEQKEVLQKSYNTNDKVIHLISDLLNVARIEAGKFLSQMKLTSIDETIESSLADYEEDLEKRKIKLELTKPAQPLPKAMIDVDKMKIAVGNLLDNAIRYTLSGGQIFISFKKTDNDEIEVQIQDTGLGIPENQQDKVFTKFFRGDNILKVETEGTGLGLFITKSIIEAHGGKIWFESKEGKGTVFYFTLPLKEGFAEFIPPELY